MLKRDELRSVLRRTRAVARRERIESPARAAEHREFLQHVGQHAARRLHGVEVTPTSRRPRAIPIREIPGAAAAAWDAAFFAAPSPRLGGCARASR